VSGPKKLRHGDLEHGTAGEWLPPQCVRKSQRERLTTDAGGVDLVEESVATEVAEDASLEGDFELADTVVRQLVGLVKLDLAAAVLAENAVEDDEVVMHVRKPVDVGEFQTAVKQLGLYWLILNESPPVRGES
jgi:hypothetical protein